ncbi:hypothetical protein [Allosaccharopolyspora coralli]|uniref:hypothetical protein n=1 Tax=Allosaccharopolyspora coralli TaxID=2665642 RepID=UPI001E2EBB38|nr:hypothetical protein [Allosaccharopolyspora coralli]
MAHTTIASTAARRVDESLNAPPVLDRAPARAVWPVGRARVVAVVSLLLTEVPREPVRRAWSDRRDDEVSPRRRRSRSDERPLGILLSPPW